MQPPFHLLREARRRLLIHRRGLGAACACLAVLVTIRAVQAPEAPAVGVWVAAHDVPAGHAIRASDLRQTAFPLGAVPPGALREPGTVLGRTLVQPLERGQLVSTRQVLGKGVLAGYPGRTAVAVRIPDAGVVGLLRGGDRIDVWATDPRATGPAELLVADAVVLAPTTGTTPGTTTGTTTAGAPSAGAGALVVLAVPTDDVAKIASAGTGDFLTVAWNR